MLRAVLGISGDTAEDLVKFVSDQDIPFQLLADEGNEVCSLYLGLVVALIASALRHGVDHVFSLSIGKT